MLEMTSSAIITIRRGGQVDRGFKITVIIGPFTDIKTTGTTRTLRPFTIQKL